MTRKPKASRSETPASARPEKAARANPNEPISATNGPTAEFVEGLYRNRLNNGNEGRLRALMSEFRALCRLEHGVDTPRQYRAITKQVRTPFVRDAWLRTTAALTQNAPVPHIEPLDASDRARRNANLGERWTAAALEQLIKDLGENLIYEAAAALVRDAESVIKVAHRPDAWADFPVRAGDPEDPTSVESADDYDRRADAFKKTSPLPFAMRVVDRESMLFGDGEWGDSWALEYGEYALPELQSRYGMVEREGRLVDPKNLLGSKPAPEGRLVSSRGHVVKLEYWDAHWWAVVVDGTMAPGFPKRNPLAPKLPYVRAKVDQDAETILYSLKHLVPALDSILTMKQNWAYLAAYPNPVIESLPNQIGGSLDLPTGEDNQPTTLQWKPGKALELPTGKTIRFLDPPPAGKDLNDMAVMYRAMIDVAGIPSTLRGMSGAGDSGYLANQMLAAVMMMYRRLAVALERQLEQACALLHWIVARRIKQTVYVLAEGEEKGGGKKWLGLKPDGEPTTTVASVEQLGPLSWTFRPILPTDEQAKAVIANQLVNAPRPLISLEHALEHFLGIEDPQAMMDRIAVEKALEEEPLKSMVTEAALREAGITPPPPPAPPAPMPMDPSMMGGMIPPGPGELTPQSPIPNGQMGAGMPAIPYLTMPGQPTPPGIPPGASVAAPGQYPGQPGNQGPPFPQIPG